MNRKRRARATPPLSAPSAPEQPRPQWYKRWPFYAGLGAVLAWFLVYSTTAISNLQALPSGTRGLFHILSTWYHTDYEWTGQWTNIGEVDARFQQNSEIDLDLLVQDDSVQGTIASDGIRKRLPLTFVLVEGALKGDLIDAVVFDYVSGEPKLFAKIVISKINYGDGAALKLTTKWQAAPFLPQEAVLWRTGPTRLLDDPDQSKTSP